MESTTLAGTHLQVYIDNENHYAATDAPTTNFYENPLPAFLAAELERLYENVFSSLKKFTIDGITEDTNAYVLSKDGRIVTIFIFRHKSRKVEVLNEVIAIDQLDVQLFAAAIFSKFSTVTAISFHAVQATIHRLPFPYQQYKCLEDVVLTLPNTQQAYLASLGKSTRQNIKYYMKGLERTHPSFNFKIYESGDLSDQLIRDIVEMSCARIVSKKKVSLHEVRSTNQLIQLAKACGFVGIVTIDGHIRAGAICSNAKTHFFLHVIAHDPKFNNWSLGTLCCYLTICECIARRGKEFHFLWGTLEYKFRFLGVQRDLYRVAVYRSRIQMLRNARMVMQIAIKGYGRLAKRWLLNPKRMNSFLAQPATWIADISEKLRAMLRLVNAKRVGTDVAGKPSSKRD